jgi:hypothetical protein
MRYQREFPLSIPKDKEVKFASRALAAVERSHKAFQVHFNRNVPPHGCQVCTWLQSKILQLGKKTLLQGQEHNKYLYYSQNSKWKSRPLASKPSDLEVELLFALMFRKRIMIQVKEA